MRDRFRIWLLLLVRCPFHRYTTPAYLITGSVVHGCLTRYGEVRFAWQGRAFVDRFSQMLAERRIQTFPVRRNRRLIPSNNLNPVHGKRPDGWNITGGAVAIVAAAIILFGPRTS